MKKFILYLVSFFAIIVVVDLSFGWGLDWLNDHAKSGEVKVLNNLCHEESNDIVIMGSSKACHHYIPKIFEDSLKIKCYNAGFDGNGVILAYGILSMMQKDCMPKMIIYDAKLQFDVYKCKKDGDYTRYYRKLRTFFKQPSIREMIASLSSSDWLKLHSGLFRYNGELFSVVNHFFSESPSSVNKGYIPLYGCLSDTIQAIKDYSEQISPIKMKYFRELVSLCKQNNIKLIVVFSPEYNTRFSKDYEPVRSLCSSEGIKILDYFDDKSFQNIALFKDHCHLNNEGAHLFSKTLINDIKEYYR